MLILGIETSCDETAAAVVRGTREILSDVIVSQIEVHREYGGVVPELASRKHIEAISVVIDQALKRAGVQAGDIEAVGVTRGPGLIGALMVGISAAKGIALSLDLPLCGVNHLQGHLFAVFLERDDVRFPFVGLVVSGGHTSLYLVRSPLDIERVGRTRDDAAGEAFDKVAKVLGLGYPGGPVIESEARGVDSAGIRFPRALMEKGILDFSFSGLKTSVLREVEERFGGKRRSDVPGSFHSLVAPERDATLAEGIRAIAAAFQDAVVDVLTEKGLRAADHYGVSQLVVCGGVAANGALRERLTIEGLKRGIEPVFPSMRLCTDNAAMIAACAHMLLAAGLADDLGFGALSRW